MWIRLVYCVEGKKAVSEQAGDAIATGGSKDKPISELTDWATIVHGYQCDEECHQLLSKRSS